jgi:hypothetical protein
MMITKCARMYQPGGVIPLHLRCRGQEGVVARRGPLVTAVVVLAGLAGFLVVNSVGGLVQAAAPAAVQTTQTTTTTTAPPSTTTTTTTAAAPAPAFPAEVVYAGRATGSRLAVAVAVKGDRAAAYLCDGRGVEAWLQGTATAGRVELASKDGSGRLSAALDGESLAGTASVGGRDYPFTVGVANPPAGLYRGSDGSTTIGWIVLPDGSQVGLATTGANSVPAPELDPASGAATLDGRRIDVERVAGGDL